MGPQLWKLAQALAGADLVPKHFRSKPANCFIALDIANRLGAGALEVMQALYVVHGMPAFKASYCIAMANRSGLYKGGLQFKTDRSDPKNLSVMCFGVRVDTGETVSKTVDMAMARAEDWTSNAKYKSIPETMLEYRAATAFIRRECPEVLLGMPTEDEAMAPRMVEATLIEETVLEAEDLTDTLNEAIEAAAEEKGKAEVVDTKTGEVTEEPDDKGPKTEDWINGQG
jgi:hypothetical protein